MNRRPALAVPPGDIIREEMEERGWTQQDLADITGRPIAAINEIINAKRKITAKTASELGAAFGVDPQLWLNLEAAYQLSLASSEDAISERAKLLSYAPIKEMQRRGWLPQTKSLSELQTAVLDFFRVSSLDEPPAITAAFRQSAVDMTTAHAAWCAWALRKAHSQKVANFSPSQMAELREEIRTLAAHTEEIRRVPAVLASYGIRFVIVKHLQSTLIDGATLWLDKNEERRQPVIALSLRHGRIDNFWFTLCHEISHVAHRDSFRLDLDIEGATEGDALDDIENRANEEAASTLIPPDKIASFILRKRPYFSAKSIIQFANLIKIHPGIVVGQLRYRKAIKFTHSSQMLIQIRDIINETAVSDGWVK